MSLDIRDFFRATNPSRAIAIENPDDRKYYIDFSQVRSGQLIEELRDNIAFFSPEEPTCALFTGHIGCGKSTELLKLKHDLQLAGFQVIYFESDEDLELGDVDIGDVLLAIARRVSQELEALNLGEPKGFKSLLQGAAKILMTEVDVALEAQVPGVGGASVNTDGEFSLSAGIGKITAKAKNDMTLRDRLNQYIGPQKNRLVDIINDELLKPAIAQLKQRGKQGLVVIVDNLDRIDNRAKAFGRPQQSYLFVDQSECLQNLHCHMVYTMPLALKFSNDYGQLTQRFTEDPKVLPMVPIQLQDGSQCDEGMTLLRHMVMARAFPDVSEAERLEAIAQIFDHPSSLDHLCRMSGGHARDLLRILQAWIKKCRSFPLKREVLDAVLRSYRNEMSLNIADEEWALLKQVQQRKKVSGDDDYQLLIQSRWVFEYRDRGESWFDVNPVLLDAKELQ